MRASWCLASVVLVVLAVLLGPVAAERREAKEAKQAKEAKEAKEAKKAGIFAPLEKGQRVELKEKSGGWEIGVMPGVALGQKVIEVGPDYVVLEDVTELTQRRIPIYAVRAVKVSQLPPDR